MISPWETLEIPQKIGALHNLAISLVGVYSKEMQFGMLKRHISHVHFSTIYINPEIHQRKKPIPPFGRNLKQALLNIKY